MSPPLSVTSAMSRTAPPELELSCPPTNVRSISGPLTVARDGAAPRTVATARAAAPVAIVAAARTGRARRRGAVRDMRRLRVGTPARATSRRWRRPSLCRNVHRGNDGFATRHLVRRHRQLVAGGGVPLSCLLERLPADHLTRSDERHEELAVIPVVLRAGADADDLRLRQPVGASATQCVLAASDRDLVLALLRHVDHAAVVTRTGDQLVDE